MSHTDPSEALPGQPHAEPLFRAFQQPPLREARRPLRWGALGLLSALGLGAALQDEEGSARVVTARGIRLLRPGMTPQEVVGLLGQPVAGEAPSGDATECMRYGRPTLESPTFILYSVCYQGGRLREVRERHYQAWQVGSDGTLVPGGLRLPAQ